MSSEAIHRAPEEHRGKNRGDRGAHPETERRFVEEIHKGVAENGEVTQGGALDGDKHRRR
jgi:hypothetical protein